MVQVKSSVVCEVDRLRGAVGGGASRVVSEECRDPGWIDVKLRQGLAPRSSQERYRIFFRFTLGYGRHGRIMYTVYVDPERLRCWRSQGSVRNRCLLAYTSPWPLESGWHSHGQEPAAGHPGGHRDHSLSTPSGAYLSKMPSKFTYMCVIFLLSSA